MSTTLIENLFGEGDTPSGEYIRHIGVLDSQGLTKSLRGTYDGALLTAASESSKDPFSRQRVSIPFGVFDSKQVFVKDQLLMVESLTGSATSTYSGDDSSVEMTCTTASGDRVIRQSKVSMPYQPGRGALIMLTGVMGGPKVNVEQRWGLFDDDDGIFWEQTESGLSVVRRTSTSGSPVDNSVAQASWNIDTLDGNGPSGLTLDTDSMNLYVIDFAWLGVGGARLGVEIDGELIYCHKFETANALSTVFIKTPLLPVRYDIENTGTTASSTTMLQTCCAAFSESGLDPIGIPVVASNRITSRSIGTTAVPTVALRLKSGFGKAVLIPLEFSTATVSSNDDIYYELVIGATVTGGSWVSASELSEANTTATSYTGGLVVQAGYVASEAGSSVQITRGRIGATGNNFTGVNDTIVLALTVFTGTADVVSALICQEVS